MWSNRKEKKEIKLLRDRGEDVRDLKPGQLRQWKEEKKAEQKRMEMRKEQERMENEHRKVIQQDENEERKAWEEEKNRRRGEIMDKTEMSSEKVDFTQGTMGLVDRLEAHRAGTYLKNVVISNRPPPDRDLNLARLRTYQPQNDMSKISLSDIEPIKLNSEFMEMPITDAMTPDQFRSLKDYCLVSDVFVHYIPLDTFFSRSSPVMFNLNDFRKVEDNVVRHFPLTHSGGYNILFTLDYCVAKEDLKYLSLTISTSLNTFRKGVTWATCKVVVTLTHMDFPIKANIQETMGVLHMADSDLKDFISDPRSSDGVITPEALRLMKGAHKRGEVENIMASKDDRKDVNSEPTVYNPGDGSVNVRDMLAGMREDALKRKGKTPAKMPSAMKKRESKEEELVKTEEKGEEEEGAYSSLKDIEVGERDSDMSENDTESLTRPFSPPQGNHRALRFGGV